MVRQSIGSLAEQTAANYLVAQKYDLLDINYINPTGYHVGEIDIIARDPKNDMVVFVEVKARKGRKNNVIPEANLTKDKIKKIEKAARNYLKYKDLVGSHWRIDAILIIFDVVKKTINIRHVKYIRN